MATQGKHSTSYRSLFPRRFTKIKKIIENKFGFEDSTYPFQSFF